jgi:hypothetical protein
MNKKLHKIARLSILLATASTHAMDIDIATGEVYISMPKSNTELILKNIGYPSIFSEEPIAQKMHSSHADVREPGCSFSAQIGFRTDSIRTNSSGDLKPLFNTQVKNCVQEKNMYALPLVGNITAHSKHFMLFAQGAYAPMLGAGHSGKMIDTTIIPSNPAKKIPTQEHQTITSLGKPRGHFADALIAVGPYFTFGHACRNEVSPQVAFTYEQQFIKHSCTIPQKTVNTWLGPALGIQLATYHNCWSLGANYYFTFAKYQRHWRQNDGQHYCFTANKAHGQRAAVTATISCTRNVDATLSLIAYDYKACNGCGNLYSNKVEYQNLFQKTYAHWTSLQALAGITYRF